MIEKDIERKPAFGLNEWEIVEETWNPEDNYHSETIFATANGYIGMRGTFEEGLSGENKGFEGTFLNGIYESGIIKYGEIAYGFPEESQTMISVANGKTIKLFLGDELFEMHRGKLLKYRRTLDMRKGLLERSLVWQSPSGKELQLDIERFVSLKRKNLAVIRYKFTPLNFNGEIKLLSAIDGNAKNSATGKDPRVGSSLEEDSLRTMKAEAGEHCASLIQQTKNSGIYIAAAFTDALNKSKEYSVTNFTDENYVELEYKIQANMNQEIQYIKFISYAASKSSVDECIQHVDLAIKDAKAAGYEVLKQEQEKLLGDYWSKADVEIKGNAELQQAIRFNLFHLMQSVGRDGKTNISAKGLTGEGYEGHYFWDTETYVIPSFLYSNPDISRKLLEYRYNTLDKARERAREMSHDKGALFPWRTIDGKECSAYYPAGTAQYHINADIAFAIKKYVEATGDLEFLLHYGAEMLFETARLWVDLGFFNKEKDGRFCINCVTGPDEYTAVVNNNCYTNLMARENLQFAYDTLQRLSKEYPNELKALAVKIALEDGEGLLWKTAAENMYVPYNEKYGIHPQDDSFLDKAVWDFEGTPQDNYPLLLHYHPLVIYRHQVCKQADMVLALFLLSHQFDIEQKKRNYEYYEKITTHDSSLSTCIFSIVASEIGWYEKAYDYFKRTSRMDLEDYHGNTKHGVHTANMAGSWMCIVNGFAGMRTWGERISFAPVLPEEWEQYSFKVFYKGCRVKVTVKKDNTIYELIEGDCLTIEHYTQRITLEAGQAYCLDNKKKEVEMYV